MLRRMLWLMLLIPLAATAAPRAWLDRDRIQLGETVTLNVETDARGGSEPDFSVLDASFRRLGSSSSTQLTIVNGRQSARTIWAVALEPLQEGVIGIPALDVGGERTGALSLTVLPGASPADAGDAEVFLEIDAQPRAPYVQQQVRYVVRLYYAVTLLEGQLEEPQISGAQVRRLGQDVNYFRTVGQRRYQVVERRYAITPESSGTLELPGPRFSGRALRSGSYGSLLGNNARLGARGESLSLDVRPRPGNAPEPWLPAQSLLLEDESGDALAQATVGEPVTLSLRLHAQGLAAEQLPELVLPRIEGAEVYPDQEVSQNRDDGEWLRGERVRKFALVPTRAGSIEIPAIGIDWWDTQSGRAARSEIPPRRIEVVAAAGQTGAAVAGTAAAAAAAAPGGDETVPAPASVETEAARPWQLAAAIFALLWLASLALLWQRRTVRASTAPSPAVPPARYPVTPDLGEATDAAQVSAALLARMRHDRPGLRSLDDAVVDLADPAQAAALRALERARFHDGDAEAAMREARDAFSRGVRWKPASEASTPEPVLPPLYPERRRR